MKGTVLKCSLLATSIAAVGLAIALPTQSYEPLGAATGVGAKGDLKWTAAYHACVDECADDGALGGFTTTLERDAGTGVITLMRDRLPSN